MTKRELKDHIFVAVVEDNMDPKKLGRCKCRVLNVFDDLPAEDIPWATPWKDLNGNQFILPEKGKVVSVVFDEGNIYKPEYIFAEHYNINLERKLSQLSASDYASMRALMFDHKTQIYSNDSEGLKMDYKFNNINITDSNIDLNLKDNFGRVHIGSSNGDQSAILGDNFLRWFDKFMTTIISNGFLGNLAAPIIPTPDMIEVYNDYVTLKDPKFLSKHVKIVDNDYVVKQNWFEWATNTPAQSQNGEGRLADGQIGDTWKSTDKTNKTTSSEDVGEFTSKSGLSSDAPATTGYAGSTTVDEANPDLTPPKPSAISPTNHPDIQAIIRTMERKKYKIFEEPYKLNIVGVRRQYEGMEYSNKFVDSLVVFWKTTSGGTWEVWKCAFTTIPGVYMGESREDLADKNGQAPFTPGGYNHPDGKVAKEITLNKSSKRFQVDRPGLGQLQPQQAIDVYFMDTYDGEPALKDNGGLLVQRDKNKTKKIEYSLKTTGSNYYFHRSGQNSSVVNNFSEGCQVFQNWTDHEYFFKLCEAHKKKNGNKFSYTLIEERDIS